MSLRRLVSGLVVVLIAAVAVPAQASAAQAFSIRTAKGANKGSAFAHGAVTFSQGGKRVRVQGWLNDICPKDGYRATFAVDTNMVNGKYFVEARKVADARGCGASERAFDFTLTYRSKIRNLLLIVHEVNADRPQAPGGDRAVKHVYCCR
jgi:hypothetical protein